jgi:hypothetical protein
MADRDDNESIAREHLMQALSGTAKSALSMIPVLAQAIAGWDAYQRSKFDRSVQDVIRMLLEKVGDLESFFGDDWLQSDEGNAFAWKVLDCAFDAQQDDKRELFVNALVSGVQQRATPQLEKLKFVEMLRSLSRASLLVLAEMHKMYQGAVRGPGRSPSGPFPHVDATDVAQKLSDRFDPYLVTASVYELESQGLFSKTGQWTKHPTGNYVPQGGFLTELCYTDFAARFVEFVAPDYQR